MHTFWIRANAVFFFGIGVLAALAGMNVVSTWIDPPKPPVVNTLKVHELRRLHKYGNSDMAILTMNMDIDLTPLWTWNVKQIFVFVFADYNGKIGKVKRNSVVIFDQLITDIGQAKIKGTDLIKYPIRDDSEELKDMSISLRIGYEIHPLFGPLQLFGTGRKVIPFTVRGQGTTNYTFPTVYM